MAKLYPPYLDGTVPSFYTSDRFIEGANITQITIPFALNKAVGKQDICGFALKIKTIQTNILLGTFTTINSEDYDMSVDCSVTFDISSLNLAVGQFYKVQLAFINKNLVIGYYSTTAVTKYTTKPLISINGLNANQTNNHLYNYTGVYSQKGGDTTEKMYSSRFTLYDSYGSLVSDSGEVIHHTYNDESSEEAHEEFTVTKELKPNQSYYMYYTVTTNNGLIAQSSRYRIIKSNTVSPDLNVTLKAELNYEEGYVNLLLINNRITDTNNEQKVTGMFYIARAASNDGYAWQDIGNFTLQAQTPSKKLYKDYSVEQGVTYRYAVQQYNNYGLRSDRIETNAIVADFEDAFLYDGVRQLKIKYNPKVASFKRDIMEQKTDTIGSQFPFIFRNGNVSYHEFPISGLISYLGDENQEFLTLEDLGLEYPTTQLESDNIAAERLFKLDVLKWLTDGRPKLFKSPSEGNYIVRLMDVSFSPIDTVGRMLHSFSATAYEIAAFNHNNLKDFNFVHVESDATQIRYSSVVIADRSEHVDAIASSIEEYYKLSADMQLNEETYHRILNAGIDISKNVTESYNLVMSPTTEGYTGKKVLSAKNARAIAQLFGKVTHASGKLNTRTAFSIEIRDAYPGTIFQIDNEKIVIGASGNYNVYLPDGIKSIVLLDEQPNLRGLKPVGIVAYSYASDLSNIFDLYYSSTVEDYPSKMWLGAPSRTKYDPYLAKKVTTNDIAQCIEDVKTTIAEVYKVRIAPRHIVPIFKSITYKAPTEVGGSETMEARYYWDPESTLQADLTKLNPAYLYQICKSFTDYKYIYEEVEGLDKVNYTPGTYYIFNGVDADTGIPQYRLSYLDYNERLTYFTRWSYEDYYRYTHTFTDMNYLHGEYVAYNQYISFFTRDYIDGQNGHIVQATSSFNQFVFNHGEPVELTEQEWCLEGEDIKLTSLIIGHGLMCELSFQTNVMTFSSEIQDYQVPKAYRDIYNGYKEKVIEIRGFIASLTDEQIQNNDPVLVDYLKKEQCYLKKIDESYETLCQYISISKKQYEEAMRV